MAIRRLFTIPLTDPDDARRRRLLNTLLVGMAVLLLVALAATFVVERLGVESQDLLRVLYRGALATLIGVIIIFAINRYGSGRLASALFLLLLIGALAVSDEPEQVVNGRSLFTFAIPILMASILLWPWASFAVAALCSLVIAVLGLRIQIVPNVLAMLGFLAVALVSWLWARSLERALEELRTANRELDRRVDERTRDLAEALAREHAELNKNQAILEGIADGVIVFDCHGRAIVANPAIGRILERSTDEILGADIERLMGSRVTIQDRNKVLELLWQRESHRSSLKFVWGTRILSVSFAPVHSPTGEVIGMVGVFRDVTGEAEVDRLKSDFVSIVSHELRTPLTSIKGYLDLVLMGAAGPVNKQQASFLEIAKANADRLNALVSDLLDISRIESGKAVLDLKVTSLSEIIDQVARGLEHEFEARGLTLKLDVPANLPEILADPVRVAQILSNLLSNAYKYTQNGGATIRARLTSNAIQVDVSDTGIGISKEDQEKIFGRFFRAEDNLVRQQPGTGLGLNITKSLVEMHGGRIWLESEPGKGTTFSFTLPLPAGLIGAEVGREIRVSESPAAFLPSGPWILVVDDSPEVAQLFQRQLQKAGYRVTVVTQGSRAVEVARQLKPELITLDLLMDVDGLTVLQQLKADPLTAKIPVVIVSVVPKPEEGFVLGAADYLVKPLEEEELIQCVRRILDQLNGGTRNRILVVDDEIDIAGWLKHSLTHYGYEVEEAYDGVQALEAVEAHKPDLILLDLKMPRMDGRTTIRKLRENEETRHIPIIVLSAHSVRDEGDQAQMLGMGVKDFLKKPIQIEELVEEVKKYLGNGRSAA